MANVKPIVTVAATPLPVMSPLASVCNALPVSHHFAYLQDANEKRIL
jgi:hypothetical protein